MTPTKIMELGERLAYHEAVLCRSTVSARRLTGPAKAHALDAHRRSLNEVLALRFQMNAHLDGSDMAVREAAVRAMKRVEEYVAPYLEMVMADA